MLAARPLPGVRVETRTPPVRDALPRMDIPVFVGFAAAGPLDVPVPIEDPVRFTAIFGGDVVLPGRAGGQKPGHGHLAGAVRAFFGNGGRRCWIVRVARGAQRNRFVLPGLVRLLPGGGREPAPAFARSEGSWSDELLVQTGLSSRILRLVDVDVAGPTASLDVAVPSLGEVGPGDVVRVTWAGPAPSLLLIVDEAVELPGSALPTSPIVLRLTGRPVWQRGEEEVPAPDPATLARASLAERLAFDLTARLPGAPPLRLAGLGFAPSHPRYFGALPSDAVLFGEAAEAANVLGASSGSAGGRPDLWREAAEPRFPLAADPDGAVYLPSSMGVLLSEAAGPADPTASPLDRDGLAVFDWRLFIDSGLAEASARDVLDRADAIRYGNPPRPLVGLHASLGIEEATMVAVPDAVHAGWRPDLASPIASPLPSSPLAHPEWWRWLDCRRALPDPPPPPLSGFVDCASTVPIEPPVLEATGVRGGSYELRWTPADDAVDELQEALSPDFAGAVAIARGARGRVPVFGRAPGDYYYRVRRLVGARTSDWSTAVAVRVPSPTGWEAVGEAEYSDATLLDVQRALVRLCAARADRVALLALPSHYDERQAVLHAGRLAKRLEPGTLSYGALWHPWTLGRDVEGAELSATPPEGAMAGVMAARAIARGAWVAPANEPLRGIVALEPSVPESARGALQDAAVNVIRQEPWGFVCLAADTLSGEKDLRPLNVRRLLILVRRAALRAGNRYAFEPNGEALRRAVKRGFDALLEEMFGRGAFAGARSREGFRVSTDESLNPPPSVDGGRLLAEIRIAPSRPLSFLTVRLVQRGESTLAEEVR